MLHPSGGSRPSLYRHLTACGGRRLTDLIILWFVHGVQEPKKTTTTTLYRKWLQSAMTHFRDTEVGNPVLEVLNEN